MPSPPSFQVNSNGLIPRPQMPPLTQVRPITPDGNTTSNTSAAAGADLISKALDTSGISGVGANVDLFA